MSEATIVILVTLAAAGAYFAGRLHGLIKESQAREELAARNAELECLHAELEEKS